MKIKNQLLTGLAVFMAFAAQGQPKVEMADAMRSEGKIYVVIGIILIVLTGLITYLVLMDRKVARLERQLRDKQG
jgi:hypothetical protein